MNETIIDFYKLLNIDIEKKHFYHYWTVPQSGGRQLFTQSNSTISKILESKKGLSNCFFFVNGGNVETVKKEFMKNGKKISYKKEIEERNKRKIKDYNAFYFDFDIIDNNGQHLADENLKNVKSGLMYKLMQLPVEPSAIVESRNGFHVYYAIAEQDRHMTAQSWKHTEIGIYNYLHNNVSDYVDNNVTDAARILRCPASIHRKTDNDTDFRVNVAYISYNRYTVAEIKTAYNITDVEEKAKTVASVSVSADTTAHTSVIDAIQRLDVGYFDYIDKIDCTDSDKVTQYIKSYNMIDFLELDTEVDDVFSSILREDNNPSCTIICNTEGEYWYHDFGTSDFYNLIHVVMKIAKVDNKTAYRFLCRLMINQNYIVDNSTIDDFIAANNQVLTDLSNSDKKYKFVKKLLVTYSVICEMLKERATMTNVPYLHYNLQCSQLYISEQTGIQRTTIRTHLMILEFIGVLKPVRAYKTMAGKKSVKTYQLNDLSDRAESIKQQADILKANCKNVFKITKSELDKLITF